MTLPRQSNATLPPKSQRRLSPCIKKIRCTVKPLELLRSMPHIWLIRSMRTTLVVAVCRLSQVKKFSIQVKSGKTKENTVKLLTDTLKLPKITSRARNNSKKFGTMPSTWLSTMPRTSSTMLSTSLDNVYLTSKNLTLPLKSLSLC